MGDFDSVSSAGRRSNHAALGSVAAWNVLCLISLALAAWCAFILCRHLCNAFLPALDRRILFGFSPYMLGHLLGHLSLILVFPVPLGVYLVILRVEAALIAPHLCEPVDHPGDWSLSYVPRNYWQPRW